MKINSNIFKSEFVKNVLTLMTGTTIAQAIPIAVTPILTRIYMPNDFGVFALFLAITAIAGAIANGQYEQAILLPKSDDDAINLVVLGVIIACVFSLLLLVIVLFFNANIANLLGNKELENWLFLVPLSTLLVGIYNSLNFFNIRKKEFKNVSISLVSKSIGLSLSQMIIGLVAMGPIGLIVGQIISFLSGNMILFKTLKEAKTNVVISKNNIKKQAIIYKKFPIYSLPSIFVNSINLNIINFLISSIFSITTLGFYSLTQRIVGIPARVIGSSFSQVYFQKASQEFNDKGTTEIIFIKTLKKLVVISIPIFLILFLVAEPVFAFVFGEEWRISGTYAKFLIPMAAVRFVSSSLSNTLSVHQKQQFGLYINLLLLITTVSIFLIGDSMHLRFIDTLKIFILFMSVEYIVFLIVYWQISKGNLIKKG